MKNKTKLITIGIALLAFGLIGVIGLNPDLVIDYGEETRFNQYVGHNFRDIGIDDLYAGYATKKIYFHEHFDSVPVITCNCYQDSREFRWYAGQLECEVEDKTTQSFQGTCHYVVDTRFKEANGGSLPNPKNMRLEWHAIGTEEPEAPRYRVYPIMDEIPPITIPL